MAGCGISNVERLAAGSGDLVACNYCQTSSFQYWEAETFGV
jgi:hypothetical protein